MGAEEREPGPDLNERLAELTQGARRYSFFKLVYMLERMYAGSPAVGQLGPASEERIRLRPDVGMTFHSSDVMALDNHKYDRYCRWIPMSPMSWPDATVNETPFKVSSPDR